MDEQRVVLVTGASSGIGRASAALLAARGFRVFGASRRPPSDIPAVTPVAMDVRDDRSVAEGVGRVLAEAGRVDVLVNCAGVVVAGPAEETLVEELREELETNLFGTVRTCRAVLPGMRQQRRGLIVNFASIAGLTGLPFQGAYCASKFAIRGWSEAMQMEVGKYGVKVAVIAPGDTKTAVTQTRLHSRGMGADSPYRPDFDSAMRVQGDNEINGWKPERVARLVLHVVTARRPGFLYIRGPLIEILAPRLRPLFPERMFLGIVRTFSGVK
jgi:NAD(P)-dependent dehydrogenase (short-subunit alcohol dehydrogenase family)